MTVTHHVLVLPAILILVRIIRVPIAEIKRIRGSSLRPGRFTDTFTVEQELA